MEKVLNTTRSNTKHYSLLTEFGYDRVPCKVIDKEDGTYYTIEYFDNVKGEDVQEKVLAKLVN